MYIHFVALPHPSYRTPRLVGTAVTFSMNVAQLRGSSAKAGQSMPTAREAFKPLGDGGIPMG